MKRMGWRGLVLVCVVIVLGAAAPGRASFPAQHQRLVFTAESSFGIDAFAVDPSGGAALMFDSVFESGIGGAVSIAPNGTKLAYTQTISGLPLSSQIPARLRGRFAQPAFPILRYADVDFQPPVGGGGFNFAVPQSQPLAAYSRPAWSPDAKQVVISSGQPGDLHLYVLDVGTANPRLVTAPAGDCVDARWSPDGEWIAFTVRDGGSSQLYLVRPDGSGLEPLSDGKSHDRQPDFSPDGSQIVFSSDRSGTWQLYVIPTVGGPATRVVDDPGDDTRPAWSPDGSLIAYSNDRAEHDEIYVIQPNGQGERRLVSMSGDAYVQDWQPVLHADLPVVRAYPGVGRRGGGAVVLRYSAWSTVPLTIEFTFDARSGTSEVSGGSEQFKLPDFRRHGVRLYRVDPRELITLRGKRPSHFRFCVVASDPWGNQAGRCSTYRSRS
jgi:dipeptidyl aminopeptidase/acylaminoacyl peptidase